jgi:hypothetical protein
MIKHTTVFSVPFLISTTDLTPMVNILPDSMTREATLIFTIINILHLDSNIGTIATYIRQHNVALKNAVCIQTSYNITVF